MVLPKGAVGGVILAALSALFFGLVGVAAKLSPWPALWKAGTAYLLAGLLLAPSLRGIAWRRSDLWRFAALTFFGGVLAPALFFLGLERAPASDVAILVTAEMVFTGALAALTLGERLSRRAWAGLFLLLASAALVAGRPATGGHSLVGAGLVLLATVGWAIDNVAGTPLSLRYPARAIIAVKGLVAGAVLLGFLVATGPLPALSRPALWSFLYTGTLGLGASAICFYAALPRIGPTLTVSIQLPGAAVIGAGGAWLLLGERLGAAHAAALVLLVGGALLLSRSGTPKAETSAG